MPSVLLVNRVYPPDRGATGRLLRDLAYAFVDAGWGVTVVANGLGPPPLTPTADGVRVIRAPAPAGRTASATARQLAALARAVLAQPAPDLAITLTDPPLLPLLGPLLRARGVGALLHWSHDVYPDLLPILGPVLPAGVQARLERLGRRARAAHDGVVAIGRCMAARLAAGGLPRDRLVTLPNWADRALPLAPAGRPVSSPEPGLSVVHAGTLGRAHPFTPLLEAAERLRRPRPDIRFTVLGDGWGRPGLARAAAARGLDTLTLLPWQDDHRFASALATADVQLILQDQRTEGLLVPCKMHAALAAGTPCLVLGPPRGEAALRLGETGAGAVLPPGDGDGARLAEILIRWADEPGWRAAMAGRARAAAREHTPDHALARWLGLAEAAVADARRRRRPTRRVVGALRRPRLGHG